MMGAPLTSGNKARIRNPKTPHLMDAHGYALTCRDVSKQIRGLYQRLFRYVEFLEGETDRLQAENDRLRSLLEKA